MNIDELRRLFDNGKIKWTIHIIRKLQERGIYRDDVNCAVSNGEIIEQYPDDYPYPSCLVSGKSLNNKPLHLVIGSDSTILYLITSYIPDDAHFEDDLTTRKEN